MFKKEEEVSGCQMASEAASGILLNGKIADEEGARGGERRRSGSGLLVEVGLCFQGAYHPEAEIRYIPEAPVSRRIMVTGV